MKLRRKTRKRINTPYTESLSQPLFPNIMWSMDFMSEALEDGRRVSIKQLQVKADNWQAQYNHGHPHKSLGRKTLEFFRYSRREIIDSYKLVKAKMNDSIESALTSSSQSITENYVKI